MTGGGQSRTRRLFLGWLHDRAYAGGFDLHRTLVAASDVPFAELSQRLDEGGSLRVHTVGGKVRSMMAPNLIGAIGRYHAMTSSRQLAVAAVEIRRLGLQRRRYPEASEIEPLLLSSPFTGERPRYDRLENGAARISYPKTADLWRQGIGSQESQSSRPGGVVLATTHFEWTLPPID